MADYSTTSDDVIEAFLKVMRRYRDEGIVYSSPIEQALYRVEDADDNGCRVRRLSKGTSVRCTTSLVADLWARLQKSNGTASLDTLTENSNRAQLSSFLQGPYVALDPAGRVRDITSSADAVNLFVDFVKRLRVDRSSGAPKLYKPGMLAAVLDGIETKELIENRIPYTKVKDRFLQRLRALGVDAGTVNALYAFYHLGSEPFWLLAYHDPDDPIRTSDGLTESKLNNSVRHALLKQPFWDLLLVPENREMIQDALTAQWWPGTKRNPVNINEALLKLAVDKSIRPILIDEGALQDLRKEAYHHQKVIPAANPHLTPQALKEDPRTDVRAAVAASKNLLSPFEYSWAVTFLDQCNTGEAREHFTDLLHGTDELPSRVKRFLAWAEKRKAPRGNDFLGFTPTAASYLLAVSAPEKYAFCKPEVYNAAAEALLGEDQIKSDPGERIAHATEFYEAALTLFQKQHDLPFTDLMHCHIAFYVMKESYGGHPDWEMLMKARNLGGGEKKPTPRRSSSRALNTILYGPPGTGKTHETIRLAVEICDGVAPEDRDQVVSRFRELQKESRVSFVTFHQSFGYEDFIEGIRPVLTVPSETEGEPAASSDVRYECRDGVFKKIAGLARGDAGQTATRSSQSDVDFEKVPIWKMSLGNTLDPEQSGVFEDAIETGRLLLGYGHEVDYTGAESEDAIRAKLHAVKPDAKEFNVKAVDRFKNEMERGDLVVISDGNHKFRAIGKIIGDYLFDSERETYPQTRAVEWLFVADESLPRERIYDRTFSQATIYKLRRSLLKNEALKQLLSSEGDSTPLNHVLIIDEINRGNIAKIMGELITLLEPDKRLGAANELRATLPYSGQSFGVPPNLYVVGTMNTADRSIAFLDAALRRRFVFQELMPESNVIRDNVGENGKIGGVDVAAMLDSLNERIELVFDRDHQIGHSYFLHVTTLGELRDVFVRTVIPLLQEYFYGDWAKLCLVLGCPYDSEAETIETANDSPLIAAKRLAVEQLLSGGDHADLDDHLRYHLNPRFLSASEEQLPGYFGSIAEQNGTPEAASEETQA